jgi:uncharacterized cupredoxin-like copper-binding protein
MKDFVRTAIVFVLLCPAVPAISAEAPDLDKALAGADWSKMETVTVTMTEYAFSPAAVVLKEGAPTRLVLKNIGHEAHYFVAEEFFEGIATRKIQGSDGEVKARFFTAVEVYPGKTLEWFLVPMRKGTFDLLCTVEGHAGRGMTGTIEVR